MKKQLRLLVMGMAVIGLLASCNKDNNNSNANKKGFTAAIEKSGDSKTHINGLDVHWTSDDHIRVANANNEVALFELTSGANSDRGHFYPVGEFDFTSPYKAVYPAVNPAQEDNTIDGTTATFKLPAEQNITATETFGEGYNPMAAYDDSGERNLQFKNLCGGLILPLVGVEDGQHVSKIVLTANNTEDILWGTGTVDVTSAEPIMSMSNTAADKHQLTLNCDITLGTEGSKKFYIMLPPSTLTTGFSVQVFDGTTVVYEKSMTWANNPEFIKRNWLMEANDQTVGEKPVVVTYDVTDLQQKSITFHGELTAEGNPAATVRGFCWSTNHNPSLSDSHVENGSGLGTYDNHVTGLTPGTTYYVRAYATSTRGTFYGDEVEFKTPTAYFSVSATNVVYLAPGNLQYRGGSYNTWRFATEQWHYVGRGMPGNDSISGNVYEGGTKCDNLKIASTYTGWIDLFGWGTSGYNNSKPWMVTPTDVQYAPGTSNLTGTHYDWGVHNAIYNPKSGTTDPAGTWRTLSRAEFDYLTKTRSSSTVCGTANARYAKSIVNGVKGLILLPDYYEQPAGINMTDINDGSVNYPNNYTLAQWNQMQAEGAMFLPMSDMRNIRNYGQANQAILIGTWCRYGVYWTSTALNDNGGFFFEVRPSIVRTSQSTRHDGYCVRLAKDTTK